MPKFRDSRSRRPGHAGKLTFGCKEGKKVALLSGRFHCYEGYRAAETVVPLRTMLMLGAKYVILTNAAGGINKEFSAGDLMVITDHINFSAHNALTGPEYRRTWAAFSRYVFRVLEAAEQNNR